MIAKLVEYFVALRNRRRSLPNSANHPSVLATTRLELVRLLATFDAFACDSTEDDAGFQKALVGCPLSACRFRGASRAVTQAFERWQRIQATLERHGVMALGP